MHRKVMLLPLPDAPRKPTAAAVLSAVLAAASVLEAVSAAEAAVSKCYYWVDEFLTHLAANRDYAVDRINQIPGLQAYKPQATYLLYVDISELQMSGTDFVEYLKKQVKLAVVPGGRQFFGEQSEGHVRICIATSRAILEEGLNRLEQGVQMLRKEK